MKFITTNKCLIGNEIVSKIFTHNSAQNRYMIKKEFDIYF